MPKDLFKINPVPDRPTAATTATAEASAKPPAPPFAVWKAGRMLEFASFQE